MAYSSCSMNQIENECVVAQVGSNVVVIAHITESFRRLDRGLS